MLSGEHTLCREPLGLTRTKLVLPLQASVYPPVQLSCWDSKMGVHETR